MRADVDLIKQNLANAELDQALKFLNDSLRNTENELTIILFQQRYNRLAKDKKIGVVDEKDFEREMNQITLAIYELLKTLKTDFVKNEMQFDPKLYFSESPFEKVLDYKSRLYAETFENDKTRSVAWELRSHFPAVAFPVTVGIKWRYHKPDNTITPYYTGDLFIAKSWSTYWFTGIWGYKEVKKWVKGTYTLEVVVEEQITVKSSFTIA